MQALRTLPRMSLISLRSSQSTRTMTTNISGGSLGKAWADKEHAAENQYFNKKDAEILAQLAAKLKNHTAPTLESIAQEKEAMLEIFAKHGVEAPDALLDDLIKFKFNDH